jgi:hypothetical protein
MSPNPEIFGRGNIDPDRRRQLEGVYHAAAARPEAERAW